MRPVFAHSVPGQPAAEWESLDDHASDVAAAAAGFAAPFGFAACARLAGLLHDIGKCSPAFQAYIADPDSDARGPDHSTAGAREALRAYPGPLGRMLAQIIAGHHAGLADGTDLDGRLSKSLEPYDGWEQVVGPLPDTAELAPSRPLKPGAPRGFREAFLIRMLFSCLVDADFLETERFYAERGEPPVERGGFTDLATLRSRLESHMARLAPPPGSLSGKAAELNALRADILRHTVGKAALDPGFFTLTVPTGGGKTLASLSFALEHAVRHGLDRVVYVIPFTSIIEQSAAVFRDALGDGAPNEQDILEHHASFDWDAAARRSGRSEAGRGDTGVDRLRRAAETWDAPVVVTTAVQFFESLFANRTSRCRKLHNLAKSVIVLDEAQTLPLPLLRPCLAALDELQRNYGASIVLCTATQPAVRKIDGALVDEHKRPIGLDIGEDRELAPDPQRLYTVLKRVEVERRPEKVSDDEIAARFAEQAQMLCIVNRRAHAQALFERIRHLPGTVHLTTLMCPAHRRAVLAAARARLKRGEPVRIVSTSLIEAGVDIDLPEVWRAAAGLESVLQAAGRCNREGKLDGLGWVVIFEPEDGKAPPDLEQAWQAGRSVLRRHADLQTPDAITDYFGELYFQKGPEALDAAKLDGERFPILRAIEERAPSRQDRDPKLAFPFASIAKAFRLIDEVMEPVIVPWRSGPDDDAAAELLRRIEAMDKPLGGDLRRLQQYVVAIPKKARDAWLRAGVLRPVHPALEDVLLRFDDLSYYDEAIGVRLDETVLRGPESNII